MGGPAALIVSIATFTVVDVIASSHLPVFEQSVQERNFLIALRHEHVTKLMRHGQRAQGAQSIHEERVRAVEGINVAFAVVGSGPARGLHSARNLQCQFIKIVLLLVEGDLAFAHQPPKVPVRRNIVESMIVNSNVGDVGGHQFNSFCAANFKELLFAGSVELQKGRSELKTLGPLSPTA